MQLNVYEIELPESQRMTVGQSEPENWPLKTSTDCTLLYLKLIFSG